MPKVVKPPLTPQPQTKSILHHGSGRKRGRAWKENSEKGKYGDEKLIIANSYNKQKHKDKKAVEDEKKVRDDDKGTTTTDTTPEPVFTVRQIKPLGSKGCNFMKFSPLTS